MRRKPSQSQSARLLRSMWQPSRHDARPLHTPAQRVNRERLVSGQRCRALATMGAGCCNSILGGTTVRAGAAGLKIERWCARAPRKKGRGCSRRGSFSGRSIPGGPRDDRRRTEPRAERAAAQARAADSPQPSDHRALVARPVAGARDAVLCLGGSAQQRLQARAGRHQSVPGRLQQPEAGVPAAVRAGRNGRSAEALPRRERRSADPREPHAQSCTTCRTWRSCSPSCAWRA